MSLYRWELDATLKGIQMGIIDERERLAVLANSIAYFSNAKSPKFKKVFDRAKEERQIEQAYKPEEAQTVKQKRIELYSKVAAAFGGERSDNGNI
ncbi:MULTISPECIES: hypothetical protein [Leuconostoc]|uniref:hypothetical protein n=1 Tax=Leuconostoc TaxID=1243 RepID=UPI0024AE0352|nr:MULTISPECIES: hypothetical protein [Leuconostoc]MDI6667052.1 hypothetical protein [Leuconostoc falkenbergense]